MRLSISHDRHTEDPIEKARWFQSLSIEERAELLCNFTDLILEINRSKVATVIQARRALEKPRPDEPTVVLVKREGNTRYVVIRSEG